MCATETSFVRTQGDDVLYIVPVHKTYRYRLGMPHFFLHHLEGVLAQGVVSNEAR